MPIRRMPPNIIERANDSGDDDASYQIKGKVRLARIQPFGTKITSAENLNQLIHLERGQAPYQRSHTEESR